VRCKQNRVEEVPCCALSSSKINKPSRASMTVLVIEKQKILTTALRCFASLFYKNITLYSHGKFWCAEIKNHTYGAPIFSFCILKNTTPHLYNKFWRAANKNPHRSAPMFCFAVSRKSPCTTITESSSVRNKNSPYGAPMFCSALSQNEIRMPHKKF
jgi:hypothetical protein